MAENPEPLITVNRDQLKQLIVDAVTEALEQQQIATTDDLNDLLELDLEEPVEDPVADPVITGDIDNGDDTGILGRHPTILQPEPRPVEPVPSRPRLAGKRLDPERLLIEVDPERVETWGPERTNMAQIVAGGKVFNARNFPGDKSIDPWQSTDRKLKWVEGPNGSPEIHSFWLEDESTLRAGLVEADSGLGDRRPYLRFATQFYAADYDPKTRQVHTTGEGHSDPLMEDGTRAGQLAFINKGIRVGPGADTVVWSASLRVQHWWSGDGHAAAPMALHSPVGCNLSGPVTTSLRRNEIQFWSKTSDPKKRAPVDYPGKNPPSKWHKTLATIPIRAPRGTELTILGEFRCDPSGEGPSYNRIYWLNPKTADVVLMGDYDAARDGNFGYWLKDKTDQFFLQFPLGYFPRAWWPPERYPETPWNHDDRTADGNMRKSDVGLLLAAVSQGQSDRVTVDDLAGHVLAVRGGAVG